MHKIVSISIVYLSIFLCNDAHAMRTRRILKLPIHQPAEIDSPITPAESKMFYNVYYRNWQNLNNILPSPARYKQWLTEYVYLSDTCMKQEVEFLENRNRRKAFREYTENRYRRN
ncbi:MAG TPA: hypothetical protein VGW78_02075 [Candidatus Babeliales bacterium]|jgi:hypothetical protein|nr:hypothetical protein [Candidatus Babeliales bacterium]